MYVVVDNVQCVVVIHTISCVACSQYTIHATRFQRGADGLPICIKRKEGEILRSIQDLGSAAVKFIFSPGAEQEPRMK